MSVVITLKNHSKLKKAGRLLGAKSEAETVELALEKVIEDFGRTNLSEELTEDFFEDLFAEKTDLSDGASIKMILNEREEANF